jgi:hypothetical protein
MKPAGFVCLLACLAGCSMSQALDEDVIRSTQYDDVACEALVARRDQLALQHGIARDFRRDGEDQPGLIVREAGWLIPSAGGGPS